MRILFVYPNVGAQVGFNYGIAALSSILKEKGHETFLINVNGEIYPEYIDDESVYEKAREISPDLIGFSIVTQQWPLAERLACGLGEHLGVPLVAGGIHVTMDPEGVASSGVFDYAVLGEADDAFPLLVEAISKKETANGIPNVWKLKGSDKFRNAVGKFADIARRPRLDYELFDFQKMTDAKGGWVGVMAGRGCPFRCTYCFNHAIVERYHRETGLKASELNYVRFLPVGEVVSNLKFLAGRYSGIDTFIFDDDTFTFDKDYVLDFCESYKKSGIGIPFVVNANPRTFDADVAEALASAGCRVLKFGLESGSARVRREVLRRHMTDGKISEAFRVADEFGLHTSAFVMIGLPAETRDELMDTVRMLGRIKPGRFRWSVFYPFPGTEAHAIAEKSGQIDRRKMSQIRSFMESSCLDFGEEHNFFIEKLNLAMPWFVNAESDLPSAEFYKGKVGEILSMNRDEFSGFEKSFSALDKRASLEMVSAGSEHYAVKYNKFMGVSSRYFLGEEAKSR